MTFLPAFWRPLIWPASKFPGWSAKSRLIPCRNFAHLIKRPCCPLHSTNVQRSRLQVGQEFTGLSAVHTSGQVQVGKHKHGKPHGKQRRTESFRGIVAWPYGADSWVNKLAWAINVGQSLYSLPIIWRFHKDIRPIFGNHKDRCYSES